MKFLYFLNVHFALVIILAVASMVAVVIGFGVFLQSQRKSTRLGGLFTFWLGAGLVFFLIAVEFSGPLEGFYSKQGSIVRGTYLGQRISRDGTNRLEPAFKLKNGNVLIVRYSQNQHRKERNKWGVVTDTRMHQNNTAHLVKNKEYTISYRYQTLKPELKPTKKYPSINNVHVTGYTANSSLIRGKWAQSNHVGHVISLNEIINAQQNN